MDVEIKNVKIFNDISFVANSARVSGVGKIKSKEGFRDPTDKEIFAMVLENDYSSALEHIRGF